MQVLDKVNVVCIIAVLCVFSGCASQRYVSYYAIKDLIERVSHTSQSKHFESYVTGGEAVGLAKEIPDILHKCNY